ncbi:hypothetical protein L218DRAFT_991795 [Marasmius fiardii PR-910]|nr:hypothetical protein L218DRAFT_991795 [Marasmius fiardii PR-910]
MTIAHGRGGGRKGGPWVVTVAGCSLQVIGLVVVILGTTLGKGVVFMISVDIGIAAAVVRLCVGFVWERKGRFELDSSQTIATGVRHSLTPLSQLSPRVRENVRGPYEDGMKNTAYACLGFTVRSVEEVGAVETNGRENPKT